MDLDRLEKALALRDSGNVEGALNEFCLMRESASEVEDYASLLLNEVTCLILVGNYDRAQRTLAAAKRLAPQLANVADFAPHVIFIEASLLRAEGRPADALGILEGLLRTYAKMFGSGESRWLYEDIQVQRALLLVEVGRFRQALPVLEETTLFKAWRHESDVYFYLGLCNFKLNNPDSASQNFLRAKEIGPSEEHRPHIHAYLGMLYFRKGEYARALEEFQSCLNRPEAGGLPTQTLHSWLAKTYRALGMTSEAERHEMPEKKRSVRS